MTVQRPGRMLTIDWIGDRAAESPIFKATGSTIRPGRWNDANTPAIDADGLRPALVSADSGARTRVGHDAPVTSRRFAVCRPLGDWLYSKVSGGDPLSTATDAYTSRQKFQRAFALELPWAAMRL